MNLSMEIYVRKDAGQKMASFPSGAEFTKAGKARD